MSGTVVSAANGADRSQWKASYNGEVKDDVKILKQLNEIREIKNTKEIDEEINKKNNNPPLDN